MNINIVKLLILLYPIAFLEAVQYFPCSKMNKGVISSENHGNIKFVCIKRVKRKICTSIVK